MGREREKLAQGVRARELIRHGRATVASRDGDSSQSFRNQGHGEGEEDEGKLIGYSPRPTTTAEPGSYARPYTGGEAKREQTSE